VRFQQGTHIRAPSITGDSEFVVLGRDKGWLIVKSKDGTVMPPVALEDAGVV